MEVLESELHQSVNQLKWRRVNIDFCGKNAQEIVLRNPHIEDPYWFIVKHLLIIDKMAVQIIIEIIPMLLSDLICLIVILK